MATTIKLKNSVTTTSVPSSLVQGEVAINITDKKVWVGNAATTPVQLLGAGVTGDVVGPASATDNAISRFDATTGKLIQNSLVTVSDTGAISAPVDASISGLTVGKGGGAVSSNTALGVSALASNTSGSLNIAIGYQAGQNATTGAAMTAIGYQAGQANTEAVLGTTFVGYQAGNANTSGANTAVGSLALKTNTSGSNNVAIGGQAMQGNTTGGSNVSVGNNSLIVNTTGGNNTAIGQAALAANTTASNNTAVGYQAAYTNSTGERITALGYQAGYAATGSFNTLVGYRGGYGITTGTLNTFIGHASGEAITTGGKNSILGAYNGNQGGLDIRTSSNNIVLSDGDGYPRINVESSFTNFRPITGTDTSGIIAKNDGGLFYFAKDSSAGGSFGYGAYQAVLYTSTNRIYAVAGSGGVYLANGGTSWTSASDLRLKNVTGTYTTALADIAQLEPIKFTWKADSENKPQVGISAQSVEKVVPEAVDSGLYIKGDDTEYLSVRYTELIPLMIASIQELSAEVDSLKTQLNK